MESDKVDQSREKEHHTTLNKYTVPNFITYQILDEQYKNIVGKLMDPKSNL